MNLTLIDVLRRKPNEPINGFACLEEFAVLAISCMLSAPGALIKTFQKSRLAVGHDLR